MKRLPILLLMLLLTASPLAAQRHAGHVRNSLPIRIVTPFVETAWVMVYPRHHWAETILFDANFLMNGYDARTSDMLYKECANCVETNPILGLHPGPGALYSYKFGMGFLENVGTLEVAKEARKKHIPVALTFIPAAVAGGFSIQAGDYNYSSYLRWRDCNRSPTCFPHKQ